MHGGSSKSAAVCSKMGGEVLAGKLLPKKHKMVVAWIAIHEDELMADWNLAVDGKKLFPIRGLDQ
ncbi:DUF4160 domain-containing protein [Thiocystis violacea]|uniref:DUF4160 domain-containing protein n=1 Tax=Thiocystis violacea TaxID=13725 RepID=UPI001F5BA7A3|nr:DUF4160 domain-containing protein [Thiocystis violacea]